MAAPLRACPLCESTGARALPHYSPAHWQVAACESCGMVYLRNPAEYEELEEDFAWEKTYVEKKEASRGSTALSPAIRAIRNALKMQRDKTASFRRWFRDGHVLDIGCGDGGRITPPMTPWGIELSRALHAEAQEKMRARGGDCIHGAGAEAIWQFEEGQFDGIIMHSYLEHETDVMGVLRGAARALKEEGALFIRVPNYGSLNRRVIGPKWCGFRYPDHVNYFTLDTLTQAARAAGFSTRLVNTVTRPVDDNLSVLCHKL